jgi:hypothetical protein
VLVNTPIIHDDDGGGTQQQPRTSLEELAASQLKHFCKWLTNKDKLTATFNGVNYALVAGRKKMDAELIALMKNASFFLVRHMHYNIITYY